MEKYLEMTITQLKEEAKNRGLKGTSAMKKQELAELLSNADKMLLQKREKKEEGRKGNATTRYALKCEGVTKETFSAPISSSSLKISASWAGVISLPRSARETS